MSNLFFFLLCAFAFASGKTIIPTLYSSHPNSVPTYFKIPTQVPHHTFRNIITDEPQDEQTTNELIHKLQKINEEIPEEISTNDNVIKVEYPFVSMQHKQPQTFKYVQQPTGVYGPAMRFLYPTFVPTQQKYITKDSNDDYTFGYNGQPDSRMEQTDKYGNVMKFYKFVDADGKLHTIQYTTGKDGIKMHDTITNQEQHRMFPVKDVADMTVIKAEVHMEEVPTMDDESNIMDDESNNMDEEKTEMEYMMEKSLVNPKFFYPTRKMIAPGVYTVPQVMRTPIAYSKVPFQVQHMYNPFLHTMQYPTGQQSYTPFMQYPTGQQSYTPFMHFPTGQQSYTPLMKYPTGQQSYTPVMKFPTEKHSYTPFMTYPTGQHMYTPFMHYPTGQQSYTPFMHFPTGEHSYTPLMKYPTGQQSYTPVMKYPTEKQSYTPFMTYPTGQHSFIPVMHYPTGQSPMVSTNDINTPIDVLKVKDQM